MEEPPKIERLLSSRGISLSNAASILKSYVSIIDQHSHHHPVDPSSSSSSANNGGQDNTLKSQQQQDVAAEKEEERLLARLNQLDPTINNNNRLGSISEDVYERLRMIMESVVAESEGRVVSAVGVYAKSKAADGSNNNEEGGDGVMEGEVENNGQDEFMKELEEAERLETEYQEVEHQQQPKIEEEEPQQEQQQQKKQTIDYEQKKKDKKAKKAAKKAKKEAKKRKASSGGDGANEEKRVKVEEDQ